MSDDSEEDGRGDRTEGDGPDDVPVGGERPAGSRDATDGEGVPDRWGDEQDGGKDPQPQGDRGRRPQGSHQQGHAGSERGRANRRSADEHQDGRRSRGGRGRDSQYAQGQGNQSSAREGTVPQRSSGQPSTPTAPAESPETEDKDSGVAGVLSFLIPGVGQIYNGQVGRGAVVLLVLAVWEIVAVILTLLTFGIFLLVWVPGELVFHVVAAYDAYNQAEKINRGDVTV